MALIRAFGMDFLKAGGLKLIHDLCIFVGPYVLHGLIQFLRDPNAPISRGYYLTGAIFCSQIAMSFCLRHYFFRCYLTGLRIRTCIVTSVYQKALSLSSAERQIRTVGEIVNLVGVDAQRVQDLTTYLHAIWYTFIQIGLALYFLWQQLGPSCLGGVAVILVMIPVTKYVSNWMGRMQQALMGARDERTDINSEALGSMKIIKIQAWEKSFQNKITSFREGELKKLLQYFLGYALSIMLWSAVPLLVAIATFTTYVLTGNQLDVASALTALALFEILRFPLFMLPKVINNLVEAGVSFSRLRSFLLCDDYTPVQSESIQQDCGISMKQASFVYDSKKPRVSKDDEQTPNVQQLNDSQWEVSLLRSQLADAEKKIKQLSDSIPKSIDHNDETVLNDDDDETDNNVLSLRRINFECKRGELIAIVGAVGSGKSSFLNSILGEVRALSGSLAVKGKLAYFAQTPFILNDSLKNNILFGHVGEPFDKVRYDKAIEACALTHDLKLLSDGDETEIGEKGITLSGGQKARVAIARAMYHDADLYLLDDPLAAVDAHVGKHLFRHCIVDELLLASSKENKNTVILVTNAIQYLSNPLVDRIIVLDEGSIYESGSYAELSQDPNSLFSSFLSVMSETAANNNDETGRESPSLSISSLSEIGEKKSSDTPTVASKEGHKSSTTSKSVSSKSVKHGNITSTTTSPLMTSELNEREKGHVGFAVYVSWAESAGGAWIGVLIIMAFGLVETINISSKWWLTYWSEANERDPDSQMHFLLIYALINMSGVLAIFGRVVLSVLSSLRASKLIFSKLLDVVLRAPMSFFDTTPLGRIINRFSKDMYTVDETLVSSLMSYLSTVMHVLGSIVVITSVTPKFIFALIPLIIFYVSQQSYFTKTYRELKRLDSVARSPIYALLGETLDGVATIRSYSAETSLKNRIISMLDEQQTAYFLTCTAQCWLAVRLEMAGTMIILSACLFAVLEHSSRGGSESFAGLAGLSISFALSVTQSLNWSVRMSSDLEANMIALERVLQYCNIPTEADHYLESDEKIDPSWPKEGAISFSEVKLNYRPNLPLVLKGLDINIPAMSKIGVVGRTGAGKSTLMVSLLRIVELREGSIFIDGVNISKIGLNLLRSKMAVVPQDPVLFSGTVRSNLDPFYEYSDNKLNEALKRVGLMKESTSNENEGRSMPRTLSSSSLHSLSSRKATESVRSLSDVILEGGSNFSVGQRQLLVFARALLCGAKIVIMDEATASVDADTDARIQRVMRTEFHDSTCIIVAHRLNTIMDSDYILVMNDGRAVEFDTPKQLINAGGYFKELVDAWEEDHN
eukprot:CAMPEP_0197828720 /NCGR_PEP_ID=MMETSP1437-20131217/5242_1 /TAXON_ID=49252 ORGANISM="Eucampia antarctica, Strain CCMP1452" /NCGR_SAMPLE_ID=MMETSP1437 /ASSEMBLY_ACC=CAM_ASM_001096 /LENGTH=1315 /DNA_ID=CAMNT_0043430055 /DNA_START=350 /DNA_END=4300 /DNA_ORIENTATION=+